MSADRPAERGPSGTGHDTARANCDDLRPIVMRDSRTPADYGPYFVGYGDEWCEFTVWDDAWTHHVMRGSTIGRSHIKVSALDRRGSRR